MNLAFNFKDKLFWIHNVLPPKLYKEMYTDFIKSRNKISFEKSTVDWHTYKEELDDMSLSYGQSMGMEKNLKNFFEKYHVIVKHNPFVNFLNSKFASHLRLTKYNQHLAWHDDHGNERKYAVTYYFNKTWGESWGGELMFKNKDEGSGFIPVLGNSMCIVKCGLRHRVNAVLKKTHPRFSIQTWVYDE